MNESERYSRVGGGGMFDFPNGENQIPWFLGSFTLDFSSNLANTLWRSFLTFQLQFFRMACEQTLFRTIVTIVL